MPKGQGYIGQALGLADVLAVAYCHAMNLRAADPEWEGRDRFLLSHGHYAIALYAALLEVGIIPEAELETFGFDDSRLPMSGMATYTPRMEMSGGSLGQGLTIAVGMALGLRLKGNPAFVYNSMSDGELDEGATWEAAMAAAHHKLGNLIVLVDLNRQQADGSPNTAERKPNAHWRANTALATGCVTIGPTRPSKSAFKFWSRTCPKHLRRFRC
jgi:transketolase